jgi:hypothetical protein
MLNRRFIRPPIQALLTIEQKTVLKQTILKELYQTQAYKQTPLENYPIRPTTQKEVLFEVDTMPYQALFLIAALFWGLAWRLEHENLFWAACVTTIITVIQYQNEGWQFKLSTESITIRTESNHLLTIPFQQIICIYLEEYMGFQGLKKELVIYYAYHSDDYAVIRTSKFGKINDTMGLIHYFFNQYKNSLPTP